MRLLAVVVLVTLPSFTCFSPSETDGAVQCGAAGDCPPGFSCGSDSVCYRNPPNGDGAVVDAPVVDAPVAIVDAQNNDAPLFDAMAGTDALIVECNDGIDNDCDGLIDFGNDPGCASALDPSELGTKQCDDGIDNDGDGGTDFHLTSGCGPTDPQCSSPNDPQE